MPEFIPFKAYRYNPERFRSLENVLAPPYDVISPAQQEELYAKSPYNFVRLDLKKKDSFPGDLYASAARELERWIAEGVFVPEDREAFYVYVQDYRDLTGRKACRVGLIGLMKIDPRRVKKHEKTLEGPKADRTALLEHLNANLSPIFGFFEDRNAAAHKALLTSLKTKPLADVELDGVRHRLFLETHPARLDRLRKLLKAKPMYIADGHHRFEVSYRYSLKRTNGSGRPGASYVMTYLCAAGPNDLTIYPTHRLLRLATGWEETLDTILKKHFNFSSHKSLGALEKRLDRATGGPCLGILARRGGQVRFLFLKPRVRKRELDVMLAQRKVIKPLLGKEDVARTGRMSYTRSSNEALDRVSDGTASVAIILSRIPVREVIRISDKGGFMPQKSTYFYPKLLSGLVFYKF